MNLILVKFLVATALSWIGLTAGADDDDALRTGRNTRKNVLFMISDDLRPELSPYNQSHAKTPHLHAFSKRALRYDDRCLFHPRHPISYKTVNR
jgi:hypothetical protein